MFKAGIGRALLAAAVLALATGPLTAGITITTFDVPDSDFTEIYDIDGNNMIGMYHGLWSYSFLWDGSTFTTINPPPGALSIRITVDAISGNNVAGTCPITENGVGVYRGFVWDGSTYTIINSPDADFVYIKGISGNNVVGHYIILSIPTSTITNSFFWDGSTCTTIIFPGALHTYAYDVSGNNVVGSYNDTGAYGGHAFLWDGSTFTTLDPPGSVRASAEAIDGNNVAGYYADANNDTHIFMWDGSDYTTIEWPQGVTSLSIEDMSGDRMIGRYFDSNSDRHSVYWDGSAFIPIDMPGAVDTYACGIDGDTIVGYYKDADNVSHGFIVTVPEPATMSLLGLGGLAVLRRRGRK